MSNPDIAMPAQDIPPRNLVESYREICREILHILNEPDDLHTCIQHILAALKTGTGVDAVGLRLQAGEDFPYFDQDGFSHDFLLTENTLLDRGKDGGLCRDENGHVRLECTCGLVLSGKTDPSNPHCTQGGSFWTNDSFAFLDLPPDQDPRLHPRNTCIHQGYASVALIPVRNREQIMGLIQLNDKRKGCFSRAAIEMLEDIAAHIGSALVRQQAEQALRENERQYRDLIEGLHEVVYRMRLPDGKYEYISSSAEEVFGYTRAAFLHNPFFIQSILHPGFAGYFEDKWKKALAGNIPTSYEYKILDPHGNERWIVQSNKAIFDEAGNIQAIEGLCQNITDRKRMETELRQSHQALRALLRRIEHAQEAERARIARDMHDDLGQNLTAINMDLKRIEIATRDAKKKPDIAAIRARAMAATEMVNTMTATVQELAASLRPGVLDDLGLAAAIRSETRRFQARSGIVCRASLPATLPDIPAPVAMAIFRIFQECLTNVARHSAATRVGIRMGIQGDDIVLHIHDDGKGIAPDVLDAPCSLGLLGMQERATALGGAILFQRGKRHGTLITVRVPHGCAGNRKH